MAQLSRSAAQRTQAHQEAILRLIEAPGIKLASWIGVWPGSPESAAQNHSGKCAQGNRFLRRLLCQAAQAAVHKKGSHLQSLFRRLIVRLGYVKAIWAIAHRLRLIIWKILHQGATCIEHGPAVNPSPRQPHPRGRYDFRWSGPPG